MTIAITLPIPAGSISGTPAAAAAVIEMVSIRFVPAVPETLTSVFTKRR